MLNKTGSILKFLFILICFACSNEPTQTDKWEVLPGTNGQILTMIENEDGIFFGGTFTAGEVTSKKYIGFYNTNTLSFEPLFTSIEPYFDYSPVPSQSGIYSMEKVGDELYFGGNFSKINGETFQNIAKYNLSNKVVSQVAGGIPFMGENSLIPVKKIIADDKNIIIGGDFDVPGCNYLQRLNITNQQGACLSIKASADRYGGVTSLILKGNDLFLSAGIYYISKIDLLTLNEEVIGSIGPVLSEFGYPGPGYINSMLLIGDNLYVGGYFGSIENVTADCLAVYNLTNKTWSSLSELKSNAPSFSIKALCNNGDNLYVSGNFENTSLGQFGITGIASYNLKNEKWEPLGSGVSGTVFSMIIKNNYLYIGGEFKKVNGKEANSFARYKL